MRLGRREASRPPLTPGTILGSYRLDRLIGRGGMGAVYLGVHLQLNRTVALKVLSPELSLDLVFRERFRREAVAQAALEHPNIVPLYEAGEDRGYPFLAMRYVAGGTLKEFIASGDLDSRTALTLLAQVADALEAAHKAGIVHRDIKPQNILIEGDTAFLADFGLTKIEGARDLTRTGHQLGTLDYMSPEQFRNEPATLRSDVYSLAAVLYECLSGTVPFKRGSDVALMYAHLEDRLPSLSAAVPGFPPLLDVLFARAMSKDPEGRPESPRAFVGDVAAALGVPLSPRSSYGGVGAAARAPRPVDAQAARESPRTHRRARWLLAAAAAGVAGVGSGVALSAIHHSGEVPTRALTALSRRVRVGTVDLDVPTTWRLRHSNRSQSAATFLLNPQNMLNVRVVREARADLARMAASSPSALTVGGYRAEAYEVRRLRPGETSVAYLFPLATNDVIATCRTTRTKAAECSRIVGTTRLHARALPSLPRATYAGRVDRILRALGAGRAKVRARLRAAATASSQAGSAQALQGVFARAAASVTRLRVRDVPADAGTNLANALRKVAHAYGSLAAAARQSRPNAYASARRKIAAAEKGATNATTRLETALKRV
ncbi:MAG TPA: serine/threonine-protein kinase [Gaiellaceae bacterium]|nr:serine/threonine-protein kinase [Gaiellaceae bacterium]